MGYSMDMNNTETTPAYDAALEIFRAASKAFRAAETAFRARTIGDTEFLSAHEDFKAAEIALDDAEHTALAGA